jgi:hypothetical protein
MPVVRIQTLTIGLRLGVFHDLTQLICAQLRFCPAFKHLSFKQEAGINIHNHLGIADQRRLQQGQFRLGIADRIHDRIEHDRLAHDRSGFCHRHGGLALKRRLPGLKHVEIMVSMAQLVGYGYHLVKRAAKIA